MPSTEPDTKEETKAVKHQATHNLFVPAFGGAQTPHKKGRTRLRLALGGVGRERETEGGREGEGKERNVF